MGFNLGRALTGRCRRPSEAPGLGSAVGGWVPCRAGCDIRLCAPGNLLRQLAAMVAELTAHGHLEREVRGGGGGDALETWAERTGRTASSRTR